MTRLRCLMVVVVGFMLSGSAVLYAYPQCYEVCGPTTDCSEECEDYGSCGNYEGGVENGWCAGECGDDYCNEYTEDSWDCPEDCTDCGDDLCNVPWEGDSCYADCGDMPDNIPGPECDPTDPVDTCPPGEVCNSNGVCEDDIDYCGGHYCVGGPCCYFPNIGYYCC